MKATVLLEDGEILEGESGAGSLTPLGYPLIQDRSADGQPDWISLAAIRYVVLPGPAAPGLVDPREATGYQKVILRFADGVVVRTFRDETFGIVGEGIRALRWDATEQQYERLLVPSQNLRGIFNVSSWEGDSEANTPIHPDAGGRADINASLVGAMVPRLRLALAEIPDILLAGNDEFALRKAIERHLDAVLSATGVHATPALRAVVLRRLTDDAFGYGPLDPLLADPEVTEIMVNAPGEIFIERKGMVSRVAAGFADEDELVHVVQRMVSRSGRRIDQASPMVDARLADGSRVNAVVPPASTRGATLTIRKFSATVDSLDGMIGSGVMSALMGRVLDLAVRSRCNILISGGTGSGKTTLLNVLASRIPDGQRIVTIEDTEELQIHHENLVALECRDTNVEGKGRLTIRDLLRNALRMRPDRIIIGEVRGVEAFDMLQAMNTGHDGGMSTIHANSPRDAIFRFESLALSGSPGLTLEAIRGQIVSAVDLVVHIARLDDGRRRVALVAELTAIPSDGPQVRQLFGFEEGQETAQVYPIAGPSKLIAKIRGHGLEVPPELVTAGDPPRPWIVNRTA
jgi:pilus assembly protein CpaF